MMNNALKGNEMNTTANTKALVEVIKFAHFYNEGFRGAMGGAPSNDKVWGIAKINGTLVNFWGRRNGTLKFKTFLKSQEAKVLAKYAEKIGGRTDGGDIYTPMSPDSALVKALTPKLTADITKFYYTAMSTGKLNTRH